MIKLKEISSIELTQLILNRIENVDKNTEKIMYIKRQDANVEGVLKTGGYIDGRSHSSLEIAGFIRERVELMESK
jgi:hypothetical protein